MRAPQAELATLAEAGRLRRLRPLPINRAAFEAGGDRWLNFSSNDYLGMSQDPAVKAAAAAAIEALGTSASGSRLTSGHLHAHEALEVELAEFVGHEAALLFGSGFLTNLGALTALCDKDSQLFSDRLNHASLVDGMEASGARWRRYRHRDLEHLERLLQRAPPAEDRWIISDAVFSMDGDRAPLVGLRALADRYRAKLFIDESHAIAAIGPGGRGLCAEAGVRAELLSCGLGKGFGSYGGFLAGDAATLQLVINRARGFIYSTALPPANIAAARAVLQRLQTEGEHLVTELQTRALALSEALRAGGFAMETPESPILPLLIGDNSRALQLSEGLYARQLICVAIRPPTVPEGTARLRLSVSLGHNMEDIARAATRILKVTEGLSPGGRGGA